MERVAMMKPIGSAATIEAMFRTEAFATLRDTALALLEERIAANRAVKTWRGRAETNAKARDAARVEGGKLRAENERLRAAMMRLTSSTPSDDEHPCFCGQLSYNHSVWCLDARAALNPTADGEAK
jgi:hypothetical protein